MAQRIDPETWQPWRIPVPVEFRLKVQDEIAEANKRALATLDKKLLAAHPKVVVKVPRLPRAKFYLTPDDPRHGTANGYTNYSCRCPLCTLAKREQNLKYKRTHPRKSRAKPKVIHANTN